MTIHYVWAACFVFYMHYLILSLEKLYDLMITTS